MGGPHPVISAGAQALGVPVGLCGWQGLFCSCFPRVQLREKTRDAVWVHFLPSLCLSVDCLCLLPSAQKPSY